MSEQPARSPAINRQVRGMRWHLAQGRCIAVVVRLARSGIPGEGGMNVARVDRLADRIDKLTVEVKAGFDQTLAAFDEHRQHAEFLTLGVREDLSSHRAETAAGFSRLERRFDGFDERFGGLKTLIKGRP